MCDFLSSVLLTGRDALCGCIELICDKTLPVHVWARGTSVRSNAALLLAGVCEKTPPQCAQTVSRLAPETSGLTKWKPLADGFLECYFTEELVVRTANAFCQKMCAVEVNDSREKLFFEKCTLIRAQSVLSMPPRQADFLPEQREVAADVMRRASEEYVSIAEITRTARVLDERLDELMPRRTRDDLYAGALAGALGCMIQKEDEG